MIEPAVKHLEDKITALDQHLAGRNAIQSLTQVSKIYPKTKSVVFVGNNYFGDNIKYAFLAFHTFAKNNGIACYFLARDSIQQNLLKNAGLPYLTTSDADYLPVMLSVKVAVIYDNFYPQNAGGPLPHALLQGAKFIQLWHGIPFKEIGLQHFALPEVMAACGPFEALVATNASSRNDWAKRFSFREFAPIGYPRNDVFLRDLSEEDLINVDMESLDRIKAAKHMGKPVILYAPTFRDHIGSAWFEKTEIMTLAEHCKIQGYIFCINLHPGEHGAVVSLRQRYPDLWFLEPFTDVYPIVRHADILLTDYSSLGLDFLLLDRPLVFYRPDHEEYVTKARSLIPGREHYAAGTVVSKVDELIEAVDAAVIASQWWDNDPFKNVRQNLRKELFDHYDGKAASRVCELIVKHLEAST